MEAIKMFQDTDVDMSIFGPRMKVLKERMKAFDQYKISHIGRDGNQVAHNLARYALHTTSQIIWLENFSKFITNMTREEAIICIESNELVF
ncbi:hypothetical protein AXF42_Ash006854 [Apostasia shenzhenica]|uniref:RNase H type-1 domain-containing protein n=1 Tax=Apostasia shenzhenica TaxID=1088818 RepID=A0A2I0AJB5_9ASPA|nr:hypothetical protein AXF42_Ash006854 [Apostasia shenzhenica]